MTKQKKFTAGTPRTPRADGAGFSTGAGGKMKQLTLFEMMYEEEKKQENGGEVILKNKQKESKGKVGNRKKIEGEVGKTETGRKEATDLMKVVASKSLDMGKVKRTFTGPEISEILRMGEEDELLSKKELREKYRRIKRRAKELEAGNQSLLIVFPSLVSGNGWYKVAEFSALYYVYRLANRMGRTAHVARDTDKFSKCHYIASLTNIEKFIEQFERFEGTRPEVTEDGIFIFTLKKPLTDDEVGELRRVEETKREKLHNLLKPKAMDPAMFQAILMVMRQVSPKVEKMHMQHYKTTGEQMIRDIEKLLAVYFDFSYGLYDRKTAGEELIRIVDRLFAALTLLSETREWKYDTAAMVGENINEVRRLIIKDFNLRAG